MGLKGIYPSPSGQAQQEYLKHGRRKVETANSISRSDLELLKIISILIIYQCFKVANLPPLFYTRTFLYQFSFSTDDPP